MENKTVFVIGAGSTAYLDIPTSERQDELVYGLKDCEDRDLFKLSRILDGTFGTENYRINDIYNIIDSNLLLHNALQYEEDKIEYYRLEECKRKLITYIFKHILEKHKSKDDRKYTKLVNFYKELAEREVKEKFNSRLNFQNRQFFVSSYSIINFNWDLYSLLPIIEANGIVNDSNNLCFATGRNPKLRIYTDFNCEYASKNGNDDFWYPFTESAACNVNSTEYDTTRKVVLLKCFYPHGAMNLFKCPACAKHSYYLGDLHIDSVIDKINYDDNDEIYNCPYCENKIYSKDFDVLAQSNFKTRNSFLEEIRLSMMQELRSAKTLVFIGYSMPSDDVDYITMFKSLNCSIDKIYTILYDDKSQNRFVSYSELNDKSKEKVKNFHNVFGDKVLYNMAGVPMAFDEVLKIV